ncbi:type VI secretion system baseplate subunit TssK [Rubrimonas cliftonensis]|uniref:Type VI secretion system protein ImpJ n=1 Tax=Rubrimonas cliftonensis TaxID=89524 RepID=A0A1H4BG84_9RHOB|nr:type VI secretion system baseplate subunit TssK [Rubrimonas cliftonensis]SEA47141.1 type VI secretion system protein ImpJ [Rubrimonas cliftonensis]
MTLSRKVMWIEGMFLRPHHFQQQDRRAESVLAARLAALQPWHWGFTKLALDERALAAGEIGLAACEGAFRDGTPFAAPGDAAPVKPLSLEADVKGAMVWLSAPAATRGAALAARSDPSGRPVAARYVLTPEEVPDTLREDGATEVIELGAPNLRLTVGPRPAEGFESLPVARVIDVSPDRRVRLDPDYIPPVLTAAASPALSGALTEIAARFDVRADGLSGRFGSAGGSSAAAQEQFMLLQVCNAKAALLGQMRDAGGVHPEPLHRALVEAAAQLSTFTDREKRRPPIFPVYDHDDLTATFAPLFAELQRSLGFLDDPEATPIELAFHKGQQIHYNRAIPPGLLTGARMVLVARAAMPDSAFRDAFPANASVASTAEILQIIGAATKGVALRPMPSFPPEIRPLAGWVCFELDQNAAAWEGVKASRSIAIHAQQSFSELQMQLWAIKD